MIIETDINYTGLVYLFKGNEMLVPKGGQSAAGGADLILTGIPADLVLKTFKDNAPNYFEVPSIDKTSFLPCFYLKKSVPLPPDWQAVSVREIAALQSSLQSAEESPAEEAGLLLRCCHIMQWRDESKYCGTCGAENGDSTGDLARLCPRCGRTEYPRISPAIITLITNDKGEALLAHNHNFAQGIYSLIAGFAEAGETLEETVRREVMEEVGLEVTDIRYAASQPWPFPNSLMIAWTALHAGGDIHCDGIEIEDARWFSRDALPSLPGHGSIARRVIDTWLAH